MSWENITNKNEYFIQSRKGEFLNAAHLFVKRLCWWLVEKLDERLGKKSNKISGLCKRFKNCPCFQAEGDVYVSTEVSLDGG